MKNNGNTATNRKSVYVCVERNLGDWGGGGGGGDGEKWKNHRTISQNENTINLCA